MALPIGNRFKHWLFGQLVASADMLMLSNQVRQLLAALGFGIAGTQAWLPAKNAVGVAPGGGMSVNVGALDQLIYLPDSGSSSIAKVAYCTGATNLAITASDPVSTRHDLVVAKYVNPDVNPQSQYVYNSGSPILTTVYDQDDTFIVEVITGAPGGGDPAVPAGWTAIARITVPPTVTTITSGDITIIIPTIQQIIANYIFNGGTVGLTAGPGIALIPTTDASGNISSLEIENIGVRSIAGLTGTPGVVSPDGSIVVGASGGNLQLSVAGGGSSPVGSMVAAAGGTGNYAPSITLPPNGGEYLVILDWSFSQTRGDNNNRHFNIAVTSGSISTIGNTGDGQSSQNANYYSNAKFTGTAAAGQTIDFNLSSDASLDCSNWSIVAVRIS